MPRKSLRMSELIKLVSYQNALEIQLQFLELAEQKNAHKLSNDLKYVRKEKVETEKRVRSLANQLHVKLIK